MTSGAQEVTQWFWRRLGRPVATWQMQYSPDWVAQECGILSRDIRSQQSGGHSPVTLREQEWPSR